MMVDFDKVFKPTKEDEIRSYEILVKLHRESIGECCTCKNYIASPSDLPGFVTDYGACRLNKDIFHEKECESYEEDTDQINGFLAEIEKLKGE